MANFRNLTVKDSYKLTPHLQRVIFEGEDLQDFPHDQEGAYVKVILENDKSTIEKSGKKPRMRSYTVAEFDEENKVLALDFMVSSHEGHTTNWALNSKVGDSIVIAGPGPRKMNDFPLTDYLFFVDLTSINTLRAYLNLVPNEATGKAIVLIPTEDDKVDLPAHANIKVQYSLISDLGQYEQFARSYNKLNENTIVFAAGEAKEVAQLKTFLKNETQVTKGNMFMSGYWKRGRTDEEYRAEKKKEE